MMGGTYAFRNLVIAGYDGKITPVPFPAEITLLDSSDGDLVVMTTEKTYRFKTWKELRAFGLEQTSDHA